MMETRDREEWIETGKCFGVCVAVIAALAIMCAMVHYQSSRIAELEKTIATQAAELKWWRCERQPEMPSDPDPIPESEQAESVEITYGATSSASTERSSKWPTVRAHYIAEHPTCAACGSRENLNVHHVVPFHDDPRLELDPKNLITLCREHHFSVGHDPDFTGPMKPNWKAANLNVRRDAARMLSKTVIAP